MHESHFLKTKLAELKLANRSSLQYINTNKKQKKKKNLNFLTQMR